MPIVHLQTRDASFPRLGKIRKGAERQNGKMGADLDHFRLASDRPHVVKAFRQVYGNEPQEIRVWLPYETPVENFNPWMEEWGTGSLKRRCDGKRQHIWLEGVSYKGVYNDDAPIPCVRETVGCSCKETGLLRVMIVELFSQGIIGYFEVETHSKRDILTLQSNLEAAYRLRPNLVGIPFILRRSANKISAPMGANRNRVEKWLLSLETDPAWVSKMFQDMYQEAIGAAPTIALPRPAISLPEAIDTEIIEEPDFLTKDEGLELWQEAVAAGHTEKSAKAILSEFGVDSFKAIPRSKANKIRYRLAVAPLSAPVPALD